MIFFIFKITCITDKSREAVFLKWFLLKFLLFPWKLGKLLWDSELQDTVPLIRFVRKSLSIKSWVLSNFVFAAYFPQALSMVLLIFLWNYWCLQVKMYFWTAKILIQLHLSLQFPAKNKARVCFKKKNWSVLILPLWWLKWEKKNVTKYWDLAEIRIVFRIWLGMCSSKVLILLGCPAMVSVLWDTW